MKKIIGLFIFIIALTYVGCNKDDNNPVEGSGATDVSFRMSNTASADTVYFTFKPSEDVKIDTIIAYLASKNFTDTYVVGEPNRVFQKDVLYQWIGYYGVKQGQSWSFNFKGKRVSNNSYFSSTITYYVP